MEQRRMSTRPRVCAKARGSANCLQLWTLAPSFVGPWTSSVFREIRLPPIKSRDRAVGVCLAPLAPISTAVLRASPSGGTSPCPRYRPLCRLSLARGGTARFDLAFGRHVRVRRVCTVLGAAGLCLRPKYPKLRSRTGTARPASSASNQLVPEVPLGRRLRDGPACNAGVCDDIPGYCDERTRAPAARSASPIVARRPSPSRSRAPEPADHGLPAADRLLRLRLVHARVVARATSSPRTPSACARRAWAACASPATPTPAAPRSTTSRSAIVVRARSSST